MPQDVSTHWNSVFDMVDFGVLYDQVIELVMDKHRLGLGDFAINEATQDEPRTDHHTRGL